MKIFIPVAACAIIALIATIPSFLRNDLPGDMHRNEPHIAYVYDYLDIFFVTEQDVIASESVFVRFTSDDIFSAWAGMNNIGGVTLIDSLFDRDITEIYHGDPSNPETTVGVELGDSSVLRLTVSEEFAAFAGGHRGHLLVESLERTFYHHVSFDEFDLTIRVVDIEAPQVRKVYKSDGESSAMVILEDNNGFALQGSAYMSFMPSGQYRIEDGKLFLSMGDEYIIFLMEEDRLIFESGTWLEFLVEKGTVFHLTN